MAGQHKRRSKFISTIITDHRQVSPEVDGREFFDYQEAFEEPRIEIGTEGDDQGVCLYIYIFKTLVVV
jgi:hypothetical protein